MFLVSCKVFNILGVTLRGCPGPERGQDAVMEGANEVFIQQHKRTVLLVSYLYSWVPPWVFFRVLTERSGQNGPSRQWGASSGVNLQGTLLGRGSLWSIQVIPSCPTNCRSGFLGGPLFSPAPPSFSAPCKPYVPIPNCYSGKVGWCGSFLLQCSLVFDLYPSTCSEKVKIVWSCCTVLPCLLIMRHLWQHCDTCLTTQFRVARLCPYFSVFSRGLHLSLIIPVSDLCN